MRKLGILVGLVFTNGYTHARICDWNSTTGITQNPWTRSISFELHDTLWSFEGLHFAGDGILLDREKETLNPDAKLVLHKQKRGKFREEVYIVGQLHIFIYEHYCIVPDYNIPGIIGILKILATDSRGIGIDAIFPIARSTQTDPVFARLIQSPRGEKLKLDFSHLNANQCHFGVQHGYRYIFSPSNPLQIKEEDGHHFFPKRGACFNDTERGIDTDCERWKNGETCAAVKQDFVTKDVSISKTNVKPESDEDEPSGPVVIKNVGKATEESENVASPDIVPTEEVEESDSTGDDTTKIEDQPEVEESEVTILSPPANEDTQSEVKAEPSENAEKEVLEGDKNTIEIDADNSESSPVDKLPETPHLKTVNVAEAPASAEPKIDTANMSNSPDTTKKDSRWVIWLSVGLVATALLSVVIYFIIQRKNVIKDEPAYKSADQS